MRHAPSPRPLVVIPHITKTRLISLANDNAGSEKLEKKSKLENNIKDWISTTKLDVSLNLKNKN